MRRLVAVALLVACSDVPRDQWAERSARVSCKNLRRCDASSFWYTYPDLGACIDDTVAATPDACTYDGAAAADCLAAMRWSCKRVGRDYDELVRRCDAVWSCETL